MHRHRLSKMMLSLRSPLTPLPYSPPLPRFISAKPPHPHLSPLPPIPPLRTCCTSSSSSPSLSSVVESAQMDRHPRPTGAIHVIIGPMFAGKTTALLRRMQAESQNGRRVAVLKSNKDRRYATDAIVTHDGARLPCWALSDLSGFRAKLGAEAYDKLDVIGIDEAQFFDDLYEFCCNAADHDGKTVIVAGLDGDYLRRSFGSVIDVIPLADSVTKLTARCQLCGQRAFFTLRKTGETQTELIGGADVYMPVCRQHYVDGQIVIEAAKIVLDSGKIKPDLYPEAAPLSG